MNRDLLAALNAARADRRAAAVVTALDGGGQRLVLDPAGDPLEREITAALRAGKARTVEGPEGPTFVNVYAPPIRLVILGAVHVAQSLAIMAARLDYAVVVLDPREAFGTPDRFPGVALAVDWPDRALSGLALDPFTAFAALTHDPKIDDGGLVQALAKGCFYVGALGSRKTHAARRERLLGRGVREAELDRIRAPIGLPIGAATPAEIAVSILAEITQALRRPEDLRTREAS